MSDNEEIQRKIRRIFEDQFRTPMEPNEEIWDQCADSLDVMEIAAEIEEEFGIDIEEKDWTELTSTRRATRYIARKLKEHEEEYNLESRNAMVLPIPCTNVPQKTVREWLAKMNEELDEIKEEAYLCLTGKADMKHMCMSSSGRHFCEECIDLITALTSMMNYAGFDLQYRVNMQRKVNKKNHERGYW